MTTETDTAEHDNTEAGEDNAGLPVGDNAAREAAKYRKRAQEAEAERDKLAGQVEGLRRHQVETIAKDFVRQPSTLWKLGLDVNDLLDENEQLDPVKVTDAARRIVVENGLDAPLAKGIVPSAGSGTGHTGGYDPTWAGLLNPNSDDRP